MNIISENQKLISNCEDCHETKEYHCKKLCNCSPEPGKALLSCGTGSAGPLPILGGGVAGLLVTNPIPVGSVTIDTTELCNPTVLLTVTAIINTVVAALPSITFRIVRCINGCSQPVGGTFTYSNAAGVLSSESFTFQFCDCNQCCGCATYSIEIISADLLAAGTTINTTISALAIEKRC